MQASPGYPRDFFNRLLGERCISRRAFARACGLSEAHVSRILRGRARLGELAAIKIARGLRHYGIRLDSTVGSDVRNDGGER